MRVLNPGPGELYDRLTVLELKIEFGQVRGVPTKAWEEEQQEIQAMIAAKAYQISETDFSELRQVNRNIWLGIDKQREYAKLDLLAQTEPILRDIAHTGIMVMEHNDIRAKMIGQINEAYGISRPEKVL